jgi:hypothetical protein
MSMTVFIQKKKNILSIIILSLLCIYFFGTHILRIHADANYQINYQGKLTNASNVAVADGVYNMRFWLLTSPSSATTSALWTESLTGSDRVQVTNGVFSIMLGSTTPFTGVDFNQTLYLGVEIGGTTTPTWDGEMSPRKILGSVPSAFTASTSQSSETLDGLDSTQFVRTDAPSSIASSSPLSLFTITQSGTGNIFDLYDGATNVFTVLDGGNIGIGTSSPSSRLTIQGISNGTTDLFSIASSSLSASSSQGYARGQYLSVNSLGKTTISGKVFNPTLVSNWDPNSASVMDTSHGIAVFGDYAYIGGEGSDNLAIVDISDPASPSTTSNWRPWNANIIDGTHTVAVAGRYAYVGGYISDNLAIVDISNPANPVTVGNWDPSDTSIMNGAFSVALSGNYAYVAGYYSDNLAIVDISNPANPVTVGNWDPNDTNIMDGAYDLAVSGKYVYMVGNFSNNLVIIDISNPANPVMVYNWDPNDTNIIERPASIAVSGNYVYIASEYSENLITLDVGALDVSHMYAGNIRVDTLTVDQTALFDNNINLRGGLMVGQNTLMGGQLSIIGSGSTTITTNTPHLTLGGSSYRDSYMSFMSNNSSTSRDVWSIGLDQTNDAFRISSSTTLGTNDYFSILNNGTIGIGTSSPTQKLTVEGNIHLTGALFDSTYSAGTSGNILQTTGTGIQWVSTTTLGIHDALTLAGTPNYLTLSGQMLTLNALDLADDLNTFSSSDLSGRITDETGTNLAVFNTNPLLAGFRSNASSTIGDGTGAGGLTIAGNSTTTGNAYVNGTLGIGTTTPSAKLSVTGSGTGNIFAFASSTQSNLLSLTARGVLTFGSTTNSDIYINGGATIKTMLLSVMKHFRTMEVVLHTI